MHSLVSHNIISSLISECDRFEYSLAGKHSIMKHNAIIILVQTMDNRYTLSNGESIQMVTALVLQLIQCIIKVPAAEEKKETLNREPDEEEVDSPKKKKKKHHKGGKKGRKRSARISSEEDEEEVKQPPPPAPVGVVVENGTEDDTPNNTGGGGPKEYYAPDADVIIVTSYEQALVTARQFLSAFLKKCSAKEQEDYRPLFENFIEDLLTCLNLPEWPSAENVLNLLGRLLVATFSSKHSDFAMRTALATTIRSHCTLSSSSSSDGA
eukprot:sb/3468258/